MRQRRRLRAHGAYLHRRGVRAQQPAIRKIKRIVHGARRMILRDIQRLEIVEVILDLRSRRRPEIRPARKICSMRRRVRVTGCRLPGSWPRPGSVTSMVPLASSRCQRRLLETDAMHLERGVNRRLGLVDSLTRGRTFGGGERPQALELLGEQPLLSQQAHAHLVERAQVAPTRRRRRAPARPALTEDPLQPRA